MMMRKMHLKGLKSFLERTSKMRRKKVMERVIKKLKARKTQNYRKKKNQRKKRKLKQMKEIRFNKCSLKKTTVHDPKDG